jgi:hypothetical protein
VREAVATTGAYAVVLGVEGGVARVRADPDGKRQVIEDAIARGVPDVDVVEFADPPAPAVILPQVSA